MEINFTKPKNINGEWKNLSLTPKQETHAKELHYDEMVKTFVRCYGEARKAVGLVRRNPDYPDEFALAQKFFEKTQSHAVAKMEYLLCSVADRAGKKLAGD